MDLAVSPLWWRAMSGRNLTISFVVCVTNPEEAEEIIARARAAWHESGNKDAQVYITNPYQPNNGPWD